MSFMDIGYYFHISDVPNFLLKPKTRIELVVDMCKSCMIKKTRNNGGTIVPSYFNLAQMQ